MTARRRERGFTYIGLMATIMILGIMMTGASRVWSFSAQRDKEAELLWVGDQYRLAIARYYAFGHRYPLALQDLIQDDRSPVARHHIRRLYRDPFTSDTDWLLIKDATGVGIMGVASSSKLTPIKQRSFADIEVGFANKDCYCDWKFVYSPPVNNNHRYSVPGQGQYGPGVVPIATPTPPSQ